MNRACRVMPILFAGVLSCFAVHAGQASGQQGSQADSHSGAYGDGSGLSAQEIEAIRSQVLRRCGLSAKLKENKLPWYFHYEFGVELMRSGAPDQALEPLQITANLKPEPADGTRMYGMWFVNYTPYYQLSQAYAQTQDWAKAWAAIGMSEHYSELEPGDRDYEQFTVLKTEVFQRRDTAE